jgi:lysozyme family protein
MLYADSELLDEVKKFYKEKFWDRMWLDKVESQHNANEIFVFGVNAGCGRAVRLAQIVSGAVADGVVGPKTVEAINRCDDKVFDAKYDEEEIKYYEAIVRNNPSKNIFMKGWKNRALAV